MSQTHPAVVTVEPSAPLQILQVPTPTPTDNEVKVLVHYVASTPLDMHQATAHLLVTPPQILGDGITGTVIETGPNVTRYRPGDQVFGFVWRSAKEKGYQLYCVASENLLAKLPEGKTMQEAVTLGNNFVTVWHTFSKDFGFELPWAKGTGKPAGYLPPKSETETSNGNKKFILVWGGSSSVGMYAIQILKYYGYENVIAVASAQHHETLKKYGAYVCFDYRGTGQVEQRIREFVKEEDGEIGYAYDCIGSVDGSVKPIASIVEAEGCRVAILLPVIFKDATPSSSPEYGMDVKSAASWAPGVIAIGVRTHFWMDNKVLAEILQPEIMPWALVTGVVEPNAQIIVEAPKMLERAQKAIDMLRDKAVSGGRLVWRIAENDQIVKALQSIQK